LRSPRRSPSHRSTAEFHAGAAPINLSGAQGTAQTISLQPGNVFCKTITFAGEMPLVTTKQITLKPTFSGCTAFGVGNVTVATNGCDFLFTAVGEMHITCPAGQEIEIKNPDCLVRIGVQTVKTVSYASNLGETDFTITTAVTALTYNECGTARNNGTWSGTTTVTGSNSKGTPIDVWYK
jgi:hypothetical protein